MGDGTESASGLARQDGQDYRLGTAYRAGEWQVLTPTRPRLGTEVLHVWDPNTARAMLGAWVLCWGCFPVIICRPRVSIAENGIGVGGENIRLGNLPPNETRPLQSKKNETPGGSHTGQ